MRIITVQDLYIESIEIQFRLAVYITTDGQRLRGELPQEFRQGHFGAELQAYCIAQYFQCHVTEPLLLEQLYEMGIDMSAAELSNILTQSKESFHQEKEEIRDNGIRHSEENTVRIATEAALMGGACHIGLNLHLPIVSDAAPQFTLFLNMLCWVHEERHYRKLIPVSENERAEIEKIRGEIWDFYEALKAYKKQPRVDCQIQLGKRFDEILVKITEIDPPCDH